MQTEMLLKRIVARPETFLGAPCVRDTRVRVATVLALLAQGETVEQVMADLEVAREDVQACIAYACAVITGDRLEAVEVRRA